LELLQNTAADISCNNKNCFPGKIKLLTMIISSSRLNSKVLRSFDRYKASLSQNEHCQYTSVAYASNTMASKDCG